MKPNLSRGKNRDLEEIKEEKNVHALDDSSEEEITTKSVKKSKKSPFKKPRGMKNGVKGGNTNNVLSLAQRAEKYYDLSEENARLKKHQTELDEDIKRMASRLKRIKSLISKERKLAGGVLGNEFEKELDVIIDENIEFKAETKKLKATIKTMKAEMKTKNVYTSSKSIGSKSKTSSKSGEDDEARVEIINKLKDRLKENMKIIESLREENIILRNGKPDVQASRDLLVKLEKNDTEVVRMQWSLQEVTANYEALNVVLEKCKQKNNSLLDEIRDKKEQIINLTAQITALERTQGAVDDLKEQLKESDQEKTDLENRLKDLLTEPFLKRESGTSSQNRIAKLEMERDEKKKIIKNLKEKILGHEEKSAKMEAVVEIEERKAKDFEEKYQELKMKYEGDGELSIENVQRQLMRIDDNAFRQTMKDLNYQGTEPNWDQNYEDGVDDIDIKDPKSLLKEIERLRLSKRDIAAELEKMQQMLKLQSDLEGEKVALVKEEAEDLRNKVKANEIKIKDLALQLDIKQKENAELRKALAGKGFTGMIGGKDFHLEKASDNMSEFSEITDETQLDYQENKLELVIESGEFHSNSLVQMLGKSKINDTTFNTFLTLSFYDHDTQATELKTGFSPLYETFFSFRNKFDDFLIQYLDTKSLLIEVHQSKLNKSKIIGTANILLKDLVAIDRENPTPKKVISSYAEIMSITNSDVVIGSIKFKMRLKNDFHQAIKIYHDRKIVEAKNEMRETTKSRTKWVSIEIVECTDLVKKGTKQKKLRPFCHYQFYTFGEHMTVASKGSNPRFDDIQNYELSFKPNFIDYIDKEHLVVTVFDNSGPVPVEEDEKEQLDDENDIIGYAKVPLKLLTLNKDISGPITILNSKGEHCGVLYSKITVSEPLRKFVSHGGTGLAVTTLWENNIIQTLCESIAKDTRFREVDQIFYIFSKEKEQLTQNSFKNVALKMKCGLTENELNMFCGSSTLFDNGKKEIIDKKEFLGVFSQPLFNAFNRHKQLAVVDEEEEKKRGQEIADTYKDRTDPASLIKKDKGKVFDVTREIILENINKIKDKLERHLMRKNQDLKDFWKEISKNKKDVSPKKFVTRILRVEGLFITELEAQIFYEFIDEENHGKVSYEDIAISCKDINVNVLLTRFKDKLYGDDETYLDVFEKFGTTDHDDLNARATFTMINNS